MEAQECSQGHASFRSFKLAVITDTEARGVSEHLVRKIPKPRKDGYEDPAQYRQTLASYLDNEYAAKAILLKHCSNVMLEGLDVQQSASNLYKQLQRVHGPDSKVLDRVLDLAEISKLSYHKETLELFCTQVKLWTVSLMLSGADQKQVVLGVILQNIEPYHATFAQGLRLRLAMTDDFSQLPSVNEVLIDLKNHIFISDELEKLSCDLLGKDKRHDAKYDEEDASRTQASYSKNNMDSLQHNESLSSLAISEERDTIRSVARNHRDRREQQGRGTSLAWIKEATDRNERPVTSEGQSTWLDPAANNMTGKLQSATEQEFVQQNDRREGQPVVLDWNILRSIAQDQQRRSSRSIGQLRGPPGS